MNEGTADSGIELDIATLLSDAIEVDDPTLGLEFDGTSGDQSSAPQYHELKSRVVVVQRWVDRIQLILARLNSEHFCLVIV